MSYSRINRTALASALSFALFAPLGAMAQDTQQAAQPEQEAPVSTTQEEQDAQSGAKPARTLEEVTVTGSRIKRASIEGPAPVTVITGEQLKAEGFSTVYDALATLTEATGTVQADAAWGSHTVNASPLNLRNMGPGRSLLLVNGRRVADYPLPYNGRSNFANYSNLPSAMVERVEILASGASAIYGSDAVAGVINVILKKDYEGNEFKIRGGTATRGGRETWDLSWVGGNSGDNWNLTYGLQYAEREPLIAKQRPDMDSEMDAHPNSWGVQQREFGFLVSTGIRMLDYSTGQRLRPPSGACDQYNGFMFEQHRLVLNQGSSPPTATDTGWQCGTNIFQYWTLKTGAEDLAGYLQGRWDFDNGTEAWASVGVWDSQGSSSSFPPLTAFYDVYDSEVGGMVNILKRITLEEMGGLDNLVTKSDERSWDAYAGLRGTMFNDRFDWDFSIGRTEYKVEESYPALLEQAGFDFFAGPQIGTAADGTPIYHVDRNRLWNPLTPDQVRSIMTHGKNTAESWVNQAQLIVSGDLFEGWAGPIGFAATLEAAEQGYELHPDPFADQGDPVPYFSPFGLRDSGGGERRRYAAGVEFKVPLLESLTATAAGRYDKYDDATATDDAFTYNAGLEWRPIDSLLFRGTYATSFRAPDMHFVFAQDSQSISDLTDIPRCVEAQDYRNCTWEAGYKIEDATIFRQGAPTLEEEEGKSWTMGFVWDITDNLSLSSDYWDIELENIIDDLGAGQILSDDAGCRFGFNSDGTPWQGVRGGAYCSTIHSLISRDATGNVTSVRVGPVNQAKLHAAGIDATLRYRLATERLGDFRFSLNYTNQMKYETQFSVTDAVTDRRDDQIRSKFRGSVVWARGNWNATLFADRTGAVKGNGFGACAMGTSGSDCPRVYERLGPYTTWNLSGGYQITDNMKVNLYIRNLLDDVAEKDPWKFDFTFTAMEVADFVGREVALEYVFKFD